MGDSSTLQIDIKQVLYSKAPKVAPKIPEFAINYLTRIVHQEEINDILSRYRDIEGVDFMRALVSEFGLRLEVYGKENLPQTDGRYIFASNHPLGGMDGICLSAFLGEHYDGRIRYLVNDLLLFIPNLRNIFIPINKHGFQSRDNARLIEEAFGSDNQIITFPAGLCSRKTKGIIRDPEWKKSFIQKALQYHRDVVPVRFEGHNSNFFYRLANIRKRLGIKANIEMLYLADEMFKNKNQTFKIHFLKPIPWQTFSQEHTPAEWARRIETLVYNHPC